MIKQNYIFITVKILNQLYSKNNLIQIEVGFDYNSFIQQYIFVLQLGILLVAMGIISFELQSKKTLSLWLLITGALALRIFVGLIDPFLHIWDEQFHALVAKNMLINPFKPTLIIDPILAYDYKFWDSNHVWLHKQPLFLWQIALSFKLFGISEFTLRFPSQIMSAILVYFIYRIGSISYSKRAGFYAAVFYVGANFLIELTSGRTPTDHNDIAFLFYVTASIWAWFEYSKSKNKYWLLLIGMFSGFAILVKWLTGLLVYSGWFIYIISNKESRQKRNNYFDLLKSLIITFIVALPWQIYILFKFPVESTYEYGRFSSHFFKAIEGHGGPWYYHFEIFQLLYGNGLNYVILISLLIFLAIRIEKSYKIPIIIWITTVYVFFSIASTKMIAFTIIVSPLIYLIVGIIIAFLYNNFKNRLNHSPLKKWLPSMLSIALIFFVFYHTLNYNKLILADNERRIKIYDRWSNNTLIYKELNNLLPSEDLIVFNAPKLDFVNILFYTEFRSRKLIPTLTDIKELKEHQITIAIFDDKELPDYILNDKEIIKIKSSIWKTSPPGKPTLYY